jgi:hypothetical protein
MSDIPRPPGDYPPGPGVPPAPGGGEGGALPARGLGQILSEAFNIYTKNAAQLLLIVAIIVVPLSILSYLLTDVALARGTETITIGGQSVEVLESRGFFLVLLVILVGAAISVIITALLQAALLRAAAQATIGDPVDIDQSYRFGLKKFGSVLLVSILVGISVAIGFLLLIIPGIILLGFLAVSVPAVVVEDVRGTNAMRRSWALVSGNFWHALGVVVVAAIITGIIAGLIGSIGGSNRIVGAIFTAIAQVIVAPYSALVTVLLYLDLRSRRESLTASQLRAELGTSG